METALEPKHPTQLRWGIAALLASLGCNLLLASLASTYFSFFFKPPGLLGSIVDSRGGFEEMAFIVPVLTVISLSCCFAAAKFSSLKRLSIYSALCGAVFCGLCFAIVHELHNWLRH